MSEDHMMWDYWRDKKGIVEAAVDYYPETLKTNYALAAAVGQAQAGLAAIDAIMMQLSEDEHERRENGSTEL